MRIGYVRVSSVEQNEARQLEGLKPYKIDKWYIEKVSGKNMEREQLKRMLDYVRDEDEVYVHDFSRLSRSVKDLLEIIETLEKKKVRLISLKEKLDTSTSSGKLMLTVIGAIAEFERQNILERQREGIAIAKEHGRYKGRRPLELEQFNEVYDSWKKGEITAVKASQLLEISRATFYKKVKAYEEKGETEKAETER